MSLLNLAVWSASCCKTIERLSFSVLVDCEKSLSPGRDKERTKLALPSLRVSSEFRTYTDNFPILLSRARLETVNAVYVFSEWETSKGRVTSLSLKIFYGCSYYVKKYWRLKKYWNILTKYQIQFDFCSDIMTIVMTKSTFLNCVVLFSAC